jgi:hypothetical protein
VYPEAHRSADGDRLDRAEAERTSEDMQVYYACPSKPFQQALLCLSLSAAAND